MASTGPSFFRTVHQEDYFHLFNEGGIPDGEKIIKLLNYNKEDVSVAANLDVECLSD